MEAVLNHVGDCSSAALDDSPPSPRLRQLAPTLTLLSTNVSYGARRPRMRRFPGAREAVRRRAVSIKQTDRWKLQPRRMQMRPSAACRAGEVG